MNSLELLSKINSIKKSNYLGEFDAYIVNTDGKRGVAFVIKDDIKISEKFNKVEICDEIFSINGKQEHVVFLFTKEEQMNEHYGLLLLDFLDMDKRVLIKENPLSWFEEWCDLLGNSKRNKMIYDVIGEMAVLLSLQKQKLNPSWNSIEKGTFDITTNDSIFEVKSSISKFDDKVTIHNQFQLDTFGLNKKLYLAFVKVEDNNAGVSIDDLFQKLVSFGFDKLLLSNYLDEIGYYNGKKERYKKFIIHEIRLYEVNSEFPKITKNNFKNDKFPDGIIKLEYTISLNGLKYTNMIVGE